MNPNPERLRIEWLASLYLEAFENDDFATQQQLWILAETDSELLRAFEQIHQDLLQEQAENATALAANVIENAVQTHLKSAEIIRESVGPITFGDVANELFRNTPDALPTDAHALNDRLRTSTEPLPEGLALSKLIALAEVKFGPAAREYWEAFRKAAHKLAIRRASEIDYQLAARQTKPPGGSP